MTRRVMVDIETLGLEPGAAILSIGAVEFGQDGLGDEFYRSIDRDSCEDAGLTVDDGTLEWWQDQDEAAREVLEGGDDLGVVLSEFVDWLDHPDEIWANSPAFDCRMLIEAGKGVGVSMPWEYYEERDYRTLTALPVASDVSHDGVKHDALDDATHQARVAADILRTVHGATLTAEITTNRAGSGDGRDE